MILTKSKINSYRFTVWVVLILVLNGLETAAQFYSGSQMTFGKNRIQYKEFLWTYYRFDDFDTYFYLNGQELAEKTAKYASEVLPKIEARLETALDGKVRFIIFNNLTDLKQSNIGLASEESYNTGGITHIIGNKIFLYFNGDQRHFESQIRSGIANVLVNQIMMGSSIGSQIKNSTLYVLPEWYTNGLLSYITEDWNTEIDNRVRDGIISGKFEKFSHLNGEEAMYAGHSLWKYVADTYGKIAIPAIVNMTQLSHSVENGFLYVIGVSYKSLLDDWLNHYKGIYQREDRRDLPENPLLKKKKKHFVYSRPKLSPDGRYLAYVRNEGGKFKIFIKDLNTGKRKRIYTGGFRIEEKVDFSYPLLAWHPNGNIFSFIVEKKGEVNLYFFFPRNKKYEKVILYNFEKIVHYDYSPDGRLLIMSAVRQGQSDLFTYNISAGSHQQLTRDPYDDLYPTFFLGTKYVLFASNRLSDTLTWDPENVPIALPATTDLFLFDFEEKSNVLRRITRTPLANEIQPVKYESGSFSYLSDETGIYNRFYGRFDSTISFIDTTVHYRYFSETFPLTNYARSILHHDMNTEAGVYAEVVFNDGLSNIYVKEALPGSELAEAEPSKTHYRQQHEKAVEKKQEQVKREVKIQREYKKRFRNVYRDEDVAPPQQMDDGKIDIDNYQFNRQAFVRIGKEGETDSTAVEGQPGTVPAKKGFELPKRLNYRVEYSINQLTTQLDFTSLNYFYQPFGGGGSPNFYNLGLNGFFSVGLTDLLEDHRIIGGFRIPLSLNNVEYLFSYANLKKRVDKELIFYRQASENEYFLGFYTFIQRFRSYQLYYVLSYPLSPVLALKGTANVRYQKSTWLSTNEVALRQPDTDEYWGGLKGEVVYDDTKELSPNILVGTRSKVFGEYTQILGEEEKNMVVLGFDVRNYQRIHRTFIWANRLAASTSFGKNQLIYYMGGVDNWLAPKFSQDTPIDPTKNYAYQTLATNMRGFYQNARNGNNFAVINSELRFPVFRYFYNRPIKSDFLNTFQVVAFGDVGMAWAGRDPYSDENSLYTRVIRDGSIYVIVREQKEPLVGGFGFGARARIFGYFFRGDVAWGVEDRLVKKPVFYISMSLDF